MEFERLMLEKDALFYLSEIVIALEYLHSKGIVYRDLKTENVMLDKKGHVKLIDFGLSKMNMGNDTLTNTFCGTVEYMAPEVILRSSGYGKPADWWSLGIFTFDLLTGRSPFHSNQGKAATKERILRGKFPTPKILTPEAGDFIRRLLRKAVPKRLGTQGAWEVKGHGLFKDLDWNMVINKQYKPPFEPFVVDDTDVQHFDEQFTSRSPRESNETPPNHKSDDPNISTKSKPVIDYTNVFEDFDYVSDKFIEEAAATANPHLERQNPDATRNDKSSNYNSDDIETDPIDDSDDSSFTWKKCSKCQLQLDIKNNRSNSNSGDENNTVEELKELRICSHGS
jgi:p70 ribosomal S6 kinase